MSNLPELDAQLAIGARRAQEYGAGVLARVRAKVGYGLNHGLADLVGLHGFWWTSGHK